MKFTIQLKLLILLAFVSAAAGNDALETIDRYLNKAVQNGYSGSVLIASGGHVLLTKGYGLADNEKQVPFKADTIFDIGSITKQFTAACILKLEMEGKLHTQDPITKYFTGVPDDKRAITLHHLLTHTAGLTDSLGEDEEMIGREEYLKAALNSKLIHPPGKYTYSNVGYSILAAVVEKVSGQEYEHFLSDKLLKPAGMMETGYRLPKWDHSRMAIGYQNGKRWGTTFDQSNFAKDVTWHLKGNGGIHSTTGDLYRWYLALRGTSILSESEKKKYFEPHIKFAANESYAYGWSVSTNDRKEKVIEHNGGNGYFMDTFAMIPEKDFVVIVSTNRSLKNTDVIAKRIDKILFENLEELPDAFMQKYEGDYLLPSGAVFHVSFNENDEAVTLLNDRDSWRLLGGTDSEDAARVKQADEKSGQLMQAILSADWGRVSTLTGIDQENINREFPESRQQLEEENGKCKDFEILGSVERRNGDYLLTAGRFKCEKQDVLKLIIWHENQLFGLRDMPDGNTKNFEHQNGNEFFSESNNRTIVFGDLDDRPVIRIRAAQNEVIARKR